jgi:hypothetical protein
MSQMSQTSLRPEDYVGKTVEWSFITRQVQQGKCVAVISASRDARELLKKFSLPRGSAQAYNWQDDRLLITIPKFSAKPPHKPIKPEVRVVPFAVGRFKIVKTRSEK